MAGDWIKLHRQSLDSQVFSDPALWRLFCWCLLKTNWKTGFFNGIEVNPGSFATGRASAADSLGMSGASWYRGIKKLESMGLISVKANNRFTVISVAKWSFFQNGEQQTDSGWTTDGQPANNKRTTNEQRMDTIEEGNKSRREEGNKTHTLSQGVDETKIDPKLLPHWRRWCEWRLATSGQAINAIAAETILMDLGRRGTEKAIRDIEFSIRKEARSILDSDNDFQKRSQPATKPRLELK